jgi:uncharacterized repeat protein (TIGR03803 family)
MPSKKTVTLLIMILVVVFGFLTSVVPTLAANKEKVLYSFCSVSGCSDGSEALGGLVFDGAGNLYGTTSGGGVYGYGTVFKLTPGAGGAWTETVLYSFCPAPGCADGAYPGYGSLVLDPAGNLYGTTSYGGVYQAACGGRDCGTVFELSPNGGGDWTESVLHSFGNGTDGREPLSGLIFDRTGNLYGTTFAGGAGHGFTCGSGCGTVFGLTPGANGTWTETVLYRFCYPHGCLGGAGPQAGLTLDSLGNLCGTASYGGSSSTCGGQGCGVVFQLTPSNGKWKERVLSSFSYRTGKQPQASLVLDTAGSLYGTTSLGGAYRYGVAFKLKPSQKGKWTESVLHSFGKSKDGTGPAAGVVFDGSGRLYSTTVGGGAYGYGTVFRLTPESGRWTEMVLHSFDNNGQDGKSPRANLVFDTAGNVYSTTSGGGASGSGCDGYGCGTVFEITP